MTELIVDQELSDILEHHGVKGMKWGVRRAENRWNKEISNVNEKSRPTLAFRNESIVRINRAVDNLNSSDKYRDVDIHTFHGKLKADYDKDAHEAIMRALEDSVRSHYGYSPSGQQHAVYNRKTDKIDIRQVAPQMQHADAPTELAPDISIQLHRNEIGLITSVTIDVLEHSDDDSESLEHFGIKGMRWGVRKDTAAGAHGPTGGSKTPLSPSEDHARVSAAQAKIKTGGTKTLSNKELQDVVSRMNLEQQYARLATSPSSKVSISKGTEAARKILGPIKIAKEVYDLVNSPFGQALKLATKAKEVGEVLA